jgi:hypothetical protein
MITHEDIVEIKRVLDERYVLQKYCDDTQKSLTNRLCNDDKRIEMILLKQEQMRTETKNGLKFNNWLTAAVLGCIVVGIVSFLFFNFGG